MQQANNAGQQGVVLHLDVDVFFCQVEQNRHPELMGRPFAIQQHQDIIAATYTAREAGVKKHCTPREARAILGRIGGVVHHVHTEPGGRVSYGPYRAVSKQLLKLLRRAGGVAVVEKASIDEAYLLVTPHLEQGRPAAEGELLAGMGEAADIARRIKQSDQRDAFIGQALSMFPLQESIGVKTHCVQHELNLTVSIGVAPNKMVAKLASQAAKPDGVLVVGTQAALHSLLAGMPAARLPRCGGQVARTLGQAGVDTVADLQKWTLQQLQSELGFPHDQAFQLHGWARGRDASAVTEQPPPKMLSIQMTLTPVPLAALGIEGPPLAGFHEGTLDPLPVGAPGWPSRVRKVLAAMVGDIVGRVLEDRAEENRWPGKFQLTLTIFRNADRKTQSYTRSSAFPAPELAEQPAPFTAQHAVLHSGLQPGNTGAPSGAPEGGPATQLEAVVLANADSLQQVMAHAMPKGWNLVQLEMAATNFGAFKRFDAPTIRRFLSKAAPAAAAPEVSLPLHADDCLTAAPQPKCMAQQPDNAVNDLAPPISVAEPDSSLKVDLSRISSAEQRFLLRQYENGKKRKQPAEPRPGTKAKLAASKGQQQTISDLFGKLK